MYSDYAEARDRGEEQEEGYERQQDYMEEQRRMGYEPETAPYPIQKESESVYSLFKKVLELERSSKVGNLDSTELGMLNMSVRDCQNIALMAYSLGHPVFGEFFKDKAEIILKTSASKRGWFVNLFVSQKKFTARADRPMAPEEVAGNEVAEYPQPTAKKKRWFGR